MYKNDLHIGEFYDCDCINNVLITFLSFEILFEHYAKAATETYHRNICSTGGGGGTFLENAYLFEA